MKTKGRRNPNWNREETILALNLFHQLNGRTLSVRDEHVLELSRILRSNPAWAGVSIKPSFRNAASVVFKLANLASASGGSGFDNNSHLDREIWRELGDDPVRTARLASAIISTFEEVELMEAIGPEPDEGVVFAEGELVTRVHLVRERSPKLRLAVLGACDGLLRCDACRTDANHVADALSAAMFEVHHMVPLSVSGRRKVSLRDCVLLCASCHRVVHAAIALRGTWLDREAISELVGAQP